LAALAPAWILLGSACAKSMPEGTACGIAKGAGFYLKAADEPLLKEVMKL
jgi:hypothetical protein